MIPVEKVVERKLPGAPIPREQLVRQFEDWRWRNVNKGPGQAAIFDLLVPKPEDTYQWRIQLNCGCIRDVVTNGDTLERLVQRSDKYHHWHSEEQLPAGQWLCHDPKCPQHRLTADRCATSSSGGNATTTYTTSSRWRSTARQSESRTTTRYGTSRAAAPDL
jgi:hypothetical protein